MKKVIIDLDYIFDAATRGVKRAATFMALGLRVAADEGVNSVALPGMLMWRFAPEPLSPAQSQHVRAEFGTWIVGQGLRELDQWTALYLDRLYHALVILAYRQGQITADDAKGYRAFRQDTNTRKKLERLKRRFDIDCPQSDHFLRLSCARNSLTHNLGLVAERYCTEVGQLRLTWMGFDVAVGDTIINDLQEEFQVGPEGADVTLRIVVREKSFSIGQRIELAPRDLHEICVTVLRACESLRDQLVKKMTEAGVQIVRPEEVTQAVKQDE